MELKKIFLIKTHNIFKKELEERIILGKELFNIKSITNEELEKKFYDWDDYNKELIKSGFNIPDNEHCTGYENCHAGVGVIDALYRNNKPQIIYTKERINCAIIFLERFVNKLKLIAVDQNIGSIKIEEIYEKSEKEDEFINQKLDEIKNFLINLDLGQEVIYNEIEELKNLYYTLSKTQWNQIFKGKLVDLGVASIIISEPYREIINILK